MKVDYPIVEVETKDGLPLFGLHLKSDGAGSALIAIHGTASNFYENVFMENISGVLLKNGISILSVNNRGADTLQNYPMRGMYLEHFEDCVKDIDAWIEFALNEGYKSVILQGHSLGTEKIVYYMNKGKHKGKVSSVILLAFADSYGNEVKYRGDAVKKLLSKAEKLVKEGKGEEPLISEDDGWLAWGEGNMPKSADSYLNLMKEDSEMSKAFPIRKGGDLEMYKKIKTPILGVIGDQKEFTAISTEDAIEVLKKENDLAEIYQIKDCNHDFEGKEEELAKIIAKFLKK